jgi:anaphase-promoting complex subunit 2
MDPKWDPEPIDAGSEFRANKPGDILSTLVSIYDSQDLFVKELQVLFAQRLLSIPIASSDPNETVERIEKERRNIEILKLRFGEAVLSVCEVMLWDITDSRRVDGYIRAQLEQPKPSGDLTPTPVEQDVVHPTIISHHFWPSLSTSTSLTTNNISTLTMPGQFQKLQQTYTTQFTKFKPDKTLRFLPHLGSVTLQLQLEDREMDVTVAPLEAALIELFSQDGKETWTLDELREGVGGVDKGSVLKALLTWIDLGVVEERTGEEGVFRVIEVVQEGGGRASSYGEGRTRQGELCPCYVFLCILSPLSQRLLLKHMLKKPLFRLPQVLNNNKLSKCECTGRYWFFGSTPTAVHSPTYFAVLVH